MKNMTYFDCPSHSARADRIELSSRNAQEADPAKLRTVVLFQNVIGPKRTFIPTPSAALQLLQTGHSLRVLDFFSV